MTPSDLALLARWQDRRDASAFNELVRRHADMVYATCRRVLNDPSDAEDVAQECFVTLVERSPRVQTSLAGWLHRLATHRAIDRLRAEHRRTAREHRFATHAPATTQIVWQDVQAHVDEAIAELPDHLREPVTRYFLGRETQSQIAESLNVSRPAVSQRIARGVGQVRQTLKKKGLPVSTPALTGLLSANTIELAPHTLTAGLGKLALAGVEAPAAALASSTIAASKVIGAGGTIIMWKKIALVAGILALGAGTFYTIQTTRRNPQVSVPAAETPDPNGYQAESAALATNQEPTHSDTIELTDQVLRSARSVDGLTAKLSTAGDNLREGLAKYLTSMRKQATWNNAKNDGDNLEPRSSKDISQDNAMHYFLLAWEQFPETLRQAIRAKWDEIEQDGLVMDPELTDLLAACQQSFEAIRQGLEVGNAMALPCRGFDEPLPHLASFRDLARAMALEGYAFAAEGNFGAAFADYATLVDFANESTRGGVIINQLVGYAMTDLGTKALQEIIAWGDAAPEDYRFLIEQLQTIDAQVHPVADGVAAEVALIDTLCEETFHDIPALRENLRQGMGASPEAAAIAKMEDDEFEESLYEVQQALIEYAALASTPYAESEGLDTVWRGEGNAIAAAFLPSLPGLLQNEARAHAQLRGAAIAASVELYALQNGAYPESLDALTPTFLSAAPEDPFTGGSFLYAPTESGYVLYSAGADMQDNGGQEGDWRADGADLVFHRD